LFRRQWEFCKAYLSSDMLFLLLHDRAQLTTSLPKSGH
jgi:hypothetical protein